MKLQDLYHLKDDPRVRFKTEVVNGRDVIIVCYMIADAEFWDLPLALECRGIVFDAETEECICRPFEKFFNVGERASTQKDNLDFTNCEVLEKRDGSMLTPVMIDGVLEWKTKKSFTSDVAISAKLAAEKDWELKGFCEAMHELGYTPIFEFTHPQHQIVIDYGKEPKFVLLAVRNIEYGFYMPYDHMTGFAKMYGIQCIKKFDITPDAMFAEMDTIRDFEGYVVVLDDKRRVKQKSVWYLSMHKIMTGLRERDVAEAVLNETVDDIKSAVSAEGKDIGIIEAIEHKIVLELEQMRLTTEELYSKIMNCSSRKEAALTYCKDINFSLAMKLFDGKEPDYTKAWSSRHLKDVSLRCIYNTTFSSDE